MAALEHDVRKTNQLCPNVSVCLLQEGPTQHLLLPSEACSLTDAALFASPTKIKTKMILIMTMWSANVFILTQGDSRASLDAHEADFLEGILTTMECHCIVLFLDQ